MMCSNKCLLRSKDHCLLMKVGEDCQMNTTTTTTSNNNNNKKNHTEEMSYMTVYF